MSEKRNQTESLSPKGKLVTAGIIFITGFLSPLLIPIVTSSDLSAGWQAYSTLNPPAIILTTISVQRKA